MKTQRELFLMFLACFALSSCASNICKGEQKPHTFMGGWPNEFACAGYGVVTGGAVGAIASNINNNQE